MDPRGRGALAGVAAAAVWAAAEPLARRAFRTPYSDVDLLGGGPVGLALHTANGAGFGYVFVKLGGRGVVDGIVAAVVENTLLWPGMFVVDRVHAGEHLPRAHLKAQNLGPPAKVVREARSLEMSEKCGVIRLSEDDPIQQQMEKCAPPDRVPFALEE